MSRRRSPPPNPKLGAKSHIQKEVVVHQLPTGSTDYVQVLVKDATNNRCTVDSLGQSSDLHGPWSPTRLGNRRASSAVSFAQSLDTSSVRASTSTPMRGWPGEGLMEDKGNFMEEILYCNWSNCVFTVSAVGRHAVRACPPIASPARSPKTSVHCLGNLKSTC